jgi:molybdopterin synthase catalytic subunit
MLVSVRYFAAARERAGGLKEESVELAPGATVGELLALLQEKHAGLRAFLPRCRVARNQAFVEPSEALKAGDEVAMIPPVAGGSDLVGLSEHTISAAALAKRVEGPQVGAIVTFEGTVRNHARGKKVLRLHYEAYGEMAQRQLQEIAAQAEQKWPGARVALVHRTGLLEIGEVSVAIAVGTPHRGDAFDACRFVIETLKRDLTIWKREFYEGGEEWVEG